jgi:hypothetical protein
LVGPNGRGIKLPKRQNLFLSPDSPTHCRSTSPTLVGSSDFLMGDWAAE